MLDDIIKLLQAAPVLSLKKPAQQEFLLRCNILGEKLTLDSFKANCNEFSDSVFTTSDKKQIYDYLAIWPDLIKELRYFLKIAHFVWQETYRGFMGGDDILPLLVALMPNDLALLKEMMAKLQFAAAVDRSSESTYYFTVLAGAAEHLIDELTKEAAMTEDDEHKKPGALQSVPVLGRIDHIFNLSGLFSIFSSSAKSMPNLAATTVKPRPHELSLEKYEIIALKLQKPLIYNAVYIIMKLSDLCHKYQNDCYLQITALLDENNIHTYDFHDEITDEEARVFAINENMKKLGADLNKNHILAHTHITTLVNQHLAYQDFLTTLTRAKKHPLTRLLELTNKFWIYKDILPRELSSEKIEMTERIRDFLAFPSLGRRSFHGTRHSTLTEVDLIDFAKQVGIKVEELNDLRQLQEKSGFVIPEPEQLAVLLRRSF